MPPLRRSSPVTRAQVAGVSSGSSSLANVGVAGSSPVSCSRFVKPRRGVAVAGLSRASQGLQSGVVSLSHASGCQQEKPFARTAAIAAIIANQPDRVVRVYSRLRFLILRQNFLDEIGRHLPRRGDVLDLGCGFGLFGLYYALTQPGRRVLGVDVNSRRIDMVRACAARLGVENAEFVAQNALEWRGDRSFDGIYMLDLIHHLPQDQVPDFLRRVRDLLRPGAVLVLKDVADRPRYKQLFTLVLDRLMIGWAPVYYWPPARLSDLLQRIGFEVSCHRLNDILPYPHVVYVCTRVDDASLAGGVPDSVPEGGVPT